MDRSLGFGSMTLNLFALLRLDFSATPKLYFLILLNIITRWPVLQKVRDQSLSIFRCL